MKKPCVKMMVAAISAIAGIASAAAAGQVTPRMDRSKLLIGAYSFNKPVHDEPHVRELKECGIDFVLGVGAKDRETLDLLHKYGIGCIASLLPGWWGGNGSNAGKMRAARPRSAYEQHLKEYVDSLDHPAIWMLNLCDEPSALDLPYLGEVCDLVSARSPKTPAYLNLYPNYASVSKNTGDETRNQLGTKTYKEHIDVYCRTVPLDYISYDFYVYTPNQKRRTSLYRQMYDNFNIVADACRRTNRSFWYIPQVNSHNAWNFEPTTRNRLRFQAYTAMAFGAEQISWACWMPGWWTNNVLTAAGEKTAQYERLKAVNAELHRFGPLYMSYRNTATHYVGFAATNGFETLGMPLLDELDTGYFMGLRTLEDTQLVVGEMSPRGRDDGSRALFVVASGDPFDYAPARRTLAFSVQSERYAEAFDANGPVDLVCEADGSYAVRLDENAAIMLVTRQKTRCAKCPSGRKTAASAKAKPVSALGGNVRTVQMASLDKTTSYEISSAEGTLRLTGAAGPLAAPLPQNKMTTKEKEVVMVSLPRGTGIVRTSAGATTEIDVDAGGETPPFALAGAGRVVKKGSGTLVIGPGDGSYNVPSVDLVDGDIIVRGGQLPAFSLLRAGEIWRVQAEPGIAAATPEEMVASGMGVKKETCDGATLVKTGECELNACGIDADVRKIVVSAGVLRIAPSAQGTDVRPEANLVANPGFEKNGAGWRKYVRGGEPQYTTQFSTPAFLYDTSPWAFGYAAYDGRFCARLHNNGGVATTVDFPAPGRYRLTLHIRPRSDDHVLNPVLAFVRLKDGRELEIFRMRPPFTQNYIEHAYSFDMPEAGPHELVLTGLGVPGGSMDDKKLDRANRTTFVDGVTLAKDAVPAPPPAKPGAVLPEDATVSIAQGAMLALDVPGTNAIRSLYLGGKRVTGTVSAATHPRYISGSGVLNVRKTLPFSIRINRDRSRMDRSKLQVGVYCLAPYARTEAHVKDVKDCGVDFIYGVPASDTKTLDLCRKYGLGVIATGAVPFWHGMGGEQAGQMRGLRPMSGYADAMKTYRDHPAIWLMDYIDEPSALDYPYIGEVTEFLKAKSPAGVTPYINLYPNYASVVGNSAKQTRNQLGTATYAEHVAEYSRHVGLDYVCFDFYLYSARGKSREPKLKKFYENFQDLADMCRATGRSLWYIPQVNSSYPELWPSENMLRFQAYLSMAFGAEQIDWACWSRVAAGETADMPGLTGWWTNNVLTLTGEKTEQYAKLKTVNAEIHRLGERYMLYRNVDTFCGSASTPVRAEDGSHVTVGEMVVREGNPGQMAYFVLASDDPFDEHPAEHSYEVKMSGKVKALGKDGPIKVERKGDGVWSFKLRSNECALIETE